ESEKTEDRINREVNRINRQIELSPYVIDDLTINVGVEPPNPEDLESLTQQNIDDISNLLKNTVSASLSMNGNLVTEEGLDDRISVFATEFQGKAVVDSGESEESLLNINNIPNYILVIIGVTMALLLLVVLILVFVIRKRRREEFEEEFEYDMFEPPVSNRKPEEEEDMDLSEFNSRANPKRKTIEKLAKGRPEDFAKLLRSWMSED
ncbi:MAG TPA: flagellar M-ring protein FliF C-terminal domain-containing protein, partial [Paenisporosarcina sp.]|nr:flagellar M-ring protein FliF C-terminal domain-containing protein [Paenisporosarcina sp.]